MTESTVGKSAIAHLIPLLDYADMDGSLFLKKDIANGIKITNDGILFPSEYGTGVNLLSEWVTQILFKNSKSLFLGKSDFDSIL